MKLKLVDIDLPSKAEFLQGLRKEQAVRCRVWNEDVVLQTGPEIRDVEIFAHGLFRDTRGDFWSHAEPVPAFDPQPGEYERLRELLSNVRPVLEYTLRMLRAKNNKLALQLTNDLADIKLALQEEE